jgi:hypothetical protein
VRWISLLAVVAGCNHRALELSADDFGAVKDLASLRDLAAPPGADLSNVADMANGVGLVDLAHPADLSVVPVRDLSVPRRVFVSSETFTGNMGGLAGADGNCQRLADAAALGGSYKAWLSDHSATPLTRFSRATVPYVLVDGSVVAVDFTELIGGSLRHAINRTEKGGTPPATTGCGAAGSHMVWTDTREDGTLFSGGETCGEWTDVSVSSSAWGDATSQGNWSLVCNGGNGPATACDSLNAIYCFEQ